MYNCEFCDKEFKTKAIINYHQRTAKYCLEKQGKEVNNKNECKYCKKRFTRKERLDTHLEICNIKIIDNEEEQNKKVQELETKNKELENKLKEVEIRNKELENKLKEVEIRNKELEDKIYKILEKAIDKTVSIEKYDYSINSNLDKIEISEEKIELEKFNILKSEYKTLLVKHNSSLKSHRYIKFKETGPCFYIIDSGNFNQNIQYKFGIAGTDKLFSINERLKNHRTLWPLLKVRFLLFTKDVLLIEKNIKMIYEKEINPNGHEIIQGIKLEDIIDSLKKLFNILNIKEYNVISYEKLKEYNDYVDTTIKPKTNNF
jgi:hypothetical protein